MADRGGQRLGLAGRHQESVLPVLHQLGDAADGAAHDRQSRRQRLGEHVAERFFPRRQREDVGVAVVAGHRGPVHRAGEDDLAAHAQLRAPARPGAASSGPVPTIFQLVAAALERGDRPDQVLDPLALDQPRHDQTAHLVGVARARAGGGAEPRQVHAVRDDRVGQPGIGAQREPAEALAHRDHPVGPAPDPAGERAQEHGGRASSVRWQGS